MGKTEDRWYMENVVKPAIEPLIALTGTIHVLIDRVDALEARQSIVAPQRIPTSKQKQDT